jgi:hypothetical protein
MRIAMLLSGRIKCYETCLLPLLQGSLYDIDVFASVNDVESKYYDDARKNLFPWVKKLYVSPYSFPERFNEIFVNVHTNTSEPKPYNPLSMFFNQRKAFNFAIEYADSNEFEYDSYLIFRADIETQSLPSIQVTDEYKLFSAVPCCNHTAPRVSRKPVGYTDEYLPWICTDIAYGNRKVIETYTETYNFCMEMMELFEGRYPCNFEPSLLQNVYDKNMPVEFFHHPHILSSSRHQ